MSDKAPTLSFQCPKLWQDMTGSETKRFCEECGHHVQNLSLLGNEAKNEILERAKTEKICVTYFLDLEGKLISDVSEESLAAKIRALRLAAIASGALALASCSEEEKAPVQAVGLIEAPTELPDDRGSDVPITGPSEPPKPDGVLDGLMDNNEKSTKK